MLRHFAVLVTMAFCLAAAIDEKILTANKDLLTKQMKVYNLLYKVDSPMLFVPELYQIAEKWNIKSNMEKYTNKLAVTEFLERWENGMIPRGRVFNMFHMEHREEAIALFRMLWYAKDLDTFFSTAAWARVHMNEGLFMYAFSIAVIHRPDLKYVRLPPLYEQYPHFFFNAEVMNKAQRAAMEDFTGMKKTVDGIDIYVIPANYSGWYMMHEDDQEWKLNYFTEDIDLNNYNYIINQDFPIWMSSEEFGLPRGYRGEQYYYVRKQLLNRYLLERVSNGMTDIKYLDWNEPIMTGFYPTMTHPNGLPFPMRTAWSKLPVWKNKYIEEVEKYESRIMDIIDSGYVMGLDGKLMDIYTREGFNMLGNIMEGNADSYNKWFYGELDAMSRRILGANPEAMTKYQIVPSALEYYSTSMRDPVFYSYLKRIISHFHKYKSRLGAYTKEELILPGVEIKSLMVDEMMTYFDLHDASIDNAIMAKRQEDAEKFIVKVRQYRLNHKPYTITLKINSDTTMKVFIRMFLGPKYDTHQNELDISENWMNFLELDQWMVELKPGMNEIKRRSTESKYVMPDNMPIEEFYAKMAKALEGSEPMTYREQLYGFPDRLILPKGKVEGMPFQLFAYISKMDEANTLKLDSPLWGKHTFDGKPMGFPMDRPMYAFNFTVPNMFFKDVLIYHKYQDNMNFTD